MCWYLAHYFKHVVCLGYWLVALVSCVFKHVVCLGYWLVALVSCVLTVQVWVGVCGVCVFYAQVLPFKQLRRHAHSN